MMTEHDNWVSFWNEKMEAKKTWYLPRYNGSMDDTIVPNVADHVVANYSTSAVSFRVTLDLIALFQHCGAGWL